MIQGVSLWLSIDTIVAQFAAVAQVLSLAQEFPHVVGITKKNYDSKRDVCEASQIPSSEI